MPSTHAHAQTYVVTSDFVQKSRSFRNVGLKTPDANDPFFSNVKDGIKSHLDQMLPNTEVRIIEMEDLSAEILSKAHSLNGDMLKNGVIVSSCVEIAAPTHGNTLEVNRIVQGNGEIIGIGPRPGHLSLKEQIHGIVVGAKGRPIILIEDGAFTGSTLSHLLSLFKYWDCPVSAIVLGFIFPKASQRLEEEFDGKVYTVETIKGIVDWMPDHDFFPCMPNCGRVLGLSINGNPYPYFNSEGFTYTFPYIRPYLDWEMLRSWSGLNTASNQQLADFSTFCLKQTYQLFKKLNDLNGKNLTFGDINGLQPAISIPCKMGESFEVLERVSDLDICATLHNASLTSSFPS